MKKIKLPNFKNLLGKFSTLPKKENPQPIKSNVLFILDAGHGGLHPETGKYVTPGKRMVKDDVEFYEGVNNRDNVRRIMKGLAKEGLECVELCPSWIDTPLRERCERANVWAKGRKAVLISIHSNAAGNGREWHPASGIDTFVYTKASKNSKYLADLAQTKLISELGHWTKDRGVRSANFAILRGTNMPAILIEGGFHTNQIEVGRMLTEDWKKAFTRAVVDACKTYNETA